MLRIRRLIPGRLDVQLALVCTIVLASTMPWFIVHEANKDLENFHESIQKQTKVLAENIAATSIEYVITNDLHSLGKLLKRSVVFPGVIDIQVSNNKGQILSDVFVNTDAKPEIRFTNKTLLPPPDIKDTLTLFNKNSIVVWAPITSGSVIGWVKLHFSLQTANTHKQERINDYMIDVSVITGLLILLLILAMHRPINMIRAAANFASRLNEKSGELIPLRSQSKELDTLFSALNTASTNLAEQDSTIKKIVKDLETQKLALDEHSIVSITDAKGIITYANDKLTNSSGFETTELLGKSHKIFSSGFHKRSFFNDMWQTLHRGDVWHGDILNHNKEGENLWMQTTIVPFLDTEGIPYKYVSIQTDITSQKKTEELLAARNISLKELTGDLEKKVEARTMDLLKANEELMQLNTMKSNFVSVVSHELRTPLTSIISFIEILKDDFEGIDLDTRQHYLSIISEESVRLGKLINDVLDLQKIDSGKMTWIEENTDLHKLALSAVDLFSKSYADKGLDLRIEMTPDEVIANVDSNKIKQVLTNLLSNAYKFTDQGSVTLKITKVIQQPTILIVDDEEMCRNYLEINLQKMGIEVISCGNAQQVLDILHDKSKQIDLLITDIIMPTMNGIELINAIRGFNEKLPIIATSVDADNDELKSLINYNVMAFIEKFSYTENFSRCIKKVFGENRNFDTNKKMVEISVTDTGLGIPESELDKVFDHFHQVDSSEVREKGGSGLGLCICLDIVEHHDGHLWVTSKPGEGSCFTFNLPLVNSNKSRISGGLQAAAK